MPKGSGGGKAKATAKQGRIGKRSLSETLALEYGCVDADGNPTPKTCKAYRVVEVQSSISTWIDHAVSTVTHLSVISVVGNIIVNFTPLGMINNLAHGERIDKALLHNFQAELSTVKEAAPYVQTVISFVPGVGQGVSAAIAAGAALAQGQSITESLVAGARGAIPGGPIAQAVFDVGNAAIQGKNILSSAVDTVATEIGGVAGQIAVEVTKKIAAGENVAATALDTLHDAMPPVAQDAFKVGMALGRGENLQVVLAQSPALIESVAKAGGELVIKNNVLTTAAAKFSLEDQKGFNVAIGLYAHGRAGLNKAKTITVRELLPESQQKAFDTGTAVWIGAHTAIQPDKENSPESKGAFYAAKGLQKAPTPIIQSVHQAIVQDKSSELGFRAGAKIAAAKSAYEASLNNDEKETWLEWFFHETARTARQIGATLFP